MALFSVGLFIMCLNQCATTTTYSRCNSLETDVYLPEPIYTGTCATLFEAAAGCLHNTLCDLISKNATCCTYHTAMDMNATCTNSEMYGKVAKDRFSSCNCTMTNVWVGVGSFYLYETPEQYFCHQGQEVCRLYGGIMAELYIEEEMEYITVNARVTGGDRIIYPNETVIVGANRLEVGRYVWNSTGEENIPSLWCDGALLCV